MSLPWHRTISLLTAAIAATTGACRLNSAADVPSPPEAMIAANPSSGEGRTTADTAATLRVGILTFDSAVSIHQRYSPLIAYLSETTGYAIALIALTQESQFAAVASGNLDFILTNPLASVQLQRLYDIKFIATQVRVNTADRFGGLIIVRQDSPIQTLEDLRGRRVACVDFETAAGGCIFQVYHLLQRGIDPHADFDRFSEIPSQDNIILAVLNGAIDAGFVRTGQLEATAAKGLLSQPEAIRILEPQSDFFHLHTTPLYPEWPVSVSPQVDPAVAAEVEAALLSLPAGHAALAPAKLRRFGSAGNYAALDALITQLQLKSWDAK